MLHICSPHIFGFPFGLLALLAYLTTLMEPLPDITFSGFLFLLTLGFVPLPMAHLAISPIILESTACCDVCFGLFACWNARSLSSGTCFHLQVSSA